MLVATLKVYLKYSSQPDLFLFLFAGFYHVFPDNFTVITWDYLASEWENYILSLLFALRHLIQLKSLQRLCIFWRGGQERDLEI